MALQTSIRWRKGNDNLFSLLLARSDGTPLRFIKSPLSISMFTWSPTGHRLAYTTSGFPSPHELFVLAEPSSQPVKLFSRVGHFDWVTWAPSGGRLLLDVEEEDRWLILDALSGNIEERLPRLGGGPRWCCPGGPIRTTF